MAPNRFRRDVREKRESTPFAEDPQSTTVFHNTEPPEIPAEWRDIEAPINFTWVGQDELAGMGWPKSRDQVRFLVEQGIDHLVTLSSDKLPPHYAFPDLKWTMIQCEDFTGPTISEIKKFIGIMDDARRDGEAVGVHCAEGRGRTGVMCACYLIYYHDISPWDAIRIMRRQRPGSVERKVQEQTVVTFGKLLSDYGKSTLEQLEEKEKELKELQKKQQEHSDNILILHTASFYGPTEKNDRQERMRRSRSMPKINQEEEVLEETVKEEINFRKHMQNFFRDNVERCRSQPRDREKSKNTKSTENEENEDELEIRTRATTPGRQLLANLKPVGTVRPTSKKTKTVSRLTSDSEDSKNEYNKHFKSFMSTTSSVKRVRSFSQTRDKGAEESHKSCKTSDITFIGKDTGAPLNITKVQRKPSFEILKTNTRKPSFYQEIENESKKLSRKPSFEQKCVEDRAEIENESKELKEEIKTTPKKPTFEQKCVNDKAEIKNESKELKEEIKTTPKKPSFEQKYVKDKAEMEHESKELKDEIKTIIENLEENRNNNNQIRQEREKVPSPTASECSMVSSLSSISKEYSATTDKPILEQDNKEVERNMVRRTSSDSSKDLPPPPITKPKCSVDESSSSNYSYYVRIRSRASSKHDAAENVITPTEEISNEEEKKDLTKKDKEVKSNANTPKTKPRMRSRATTKKSELNNLSTSNETTSVSKSKKKPRSKTVDKDMVVKETVSKNKTESNDTDQESNATNIPLKEAEKSTSPPPKASPPETTINSCPYMKMIFGDDSDNVTQPDKKPLPSPQDVRSEKTMADARTSLLQAKPNIRRRSSNSSNKGCCVEGGSDSNNNDTTPRPSPCKYTGSLSNSSVQSSLNSSVTSVVCTSTTNENENNSKGNRKRVNKIYDRSDSNSSYKSNGHCATLTGNDAENLSNENLNKERKRSLSKGVDNTNTSNYKTDTNTTAINSSTTPSSITQINNVTHISNSTFENSSSLNSTDTSFQEKDKEKSERMQRITYRRSRTGPIADLNSVDPNDNHKSSEKSYRNDIDNNTQTTPAPSSVNSSITKESNSKNEATYTPKTKMKGTLHYSTYRMSYGMRAKSECNLADYDNSINDNEQYRSTEDNSRNANSASSSTENHSYGLSTTNRDNQFLNAAKRWASYDKTPYISPFARDSWKRTHRKFNYSRFLNYTRETFV